MTSSADPFVPATQPPFMPDWFAGADPEDAERWRLWWETTPTPASLDTARAAWAAIGPALARPTSRSVEEWSALLRVASESLITALLEALPESDDDVTAGAGFFQSALNRQLESRGAPVRIGLVYPGARFDPDTMESVEALSENRFLVSAVRSWLVRDVSGPKPKVASRARVVTA